MEPADSFRNLLMVAASDGRMTEAELRMLADRATEWGVTDDEFENALQDALQGRVEFTVPPDDKSRRQLLMDMIRMMAADGKMSLPEKKLFALASTMIGLSTEELNELIDAVVNEEPE